MNPLALRHRSLLPVLYVGHELTRRADESLRAHGVGVVAADSAARAKRLLSHFRVAAIVFALPDLRGVMELSATGIPVILLAGREAACDLDRVTVLPRATDPVELAAIIHGLMRRSPARDAA
jgi:hypothetical protein